MKVCISMLCILIASLLPSSAGDRDRPTCPLGWIQFLNKCYHFNINWDTLLKTQTYCQSFNSSLASIQNEQENKFLNNLILNQFKEHNTWLGVTPVTPQHRVVDYRWLDGTAIKYQNWFPNEPKCNASCCGVEMFKKQNVTGKGAIGWRDIPCDSKSRKLCQKTLVEPENNSKSNNYNNNSTNNVEVDQNSPKNTTVNVETEIDISMVGMKAKMDIFEQQLNTLMSASIKMLKMTTDLNSSIIYFFSIMKEIVIVRNQIEVESEMQAIRYLNLAYNSSIIMDITGKLEEAVHSMTRNCSRVFETMIYTNGPGAGGKGAGIPRIVNDQLVQILKRIESLDQKCEAISKIKAAQEGNDGKLDGLLLMMRETKKTLNELISTKKYLHNDPRTGSVLPPKQASFAQNNALVAFIAVIFTIFVVCSILAFCAIYSKLKKIEVTSMCRCECFEMRGSVKNEASKSEDKGVNGRKYSMF